MLSLSSTVSTIYFSVKELQKLKKGLVASCSGTATVSACRFFLCDYYLKVDGNEKLGGLRFLQLLGIGLGPWRSMSIFILNRPFANAKRISVSAHSSKMNRRLVCN
jgi:hypothetical protein